MDKSNNRIAGRCCDKKDVSGGDKEETRGCCGHKIYTDCFSTTNCQEAPPAPSLSPEEKGSHAPNNKILSYCIYIYIYIISHVFPCLLGGSGG